MFRFRVVLALGLLSAAPAVASAQASDAEKQAQRAFEEGKALRQRGRWDEACVKFEEAHHLFSTGGTTLSFADCEERAGHLAAARALYQQIVDDPKERIHTERVEVAKQRVTAIDARIAAADASKAAEAPPTPQPPPRPPPALPSAPTEPAHSASAGPWVVGGTGVALLVASAVMGGLVLHDKSVVDDHCSDRKKVCDADGTAASSRGRILGPLTTVGLATGGAAVAAGVIWLIVDGRRSSASKKEPPPLAWAPIVTREGAELRLGGRW